MLKRARVLIPFLSQTNTSLNELSLYEYMRAGGYNDPEDIPGSAFSRNIAQTNNLGALLHDNHRHGVTWSENPFFYPGSNTFRVRHLREFESRLLEFLYQVCYEEAEFTVIAEAGLPNGRATTWYRQFVAIAPFPSAPVTPPAERAAMMERLRAEQEARASEAARHEAMTQAAARQNNRDFDGVIEIDGVQFFLNERDRMLNERLALGISDTESEPDPEIEFVDPIPPPEVFARGREAIARAEQVDPEAIPMNLADIEDLAADLEANGLAELQQHNLVQRRLWIEDFGGDYDRGMRSDYGYSQDGPELERSPPSELDDDEIEAVLE